MSAFGFTKSGFKASNAVITGGCIYALFAPATATAGSSPIGMLTNTAFGTTLSQRAANSAAALAWNTLGVNYMGTTGNTATKGIAGMAVLGGVAMKFAGKVVNPLMAGSPVKL